MANKKRIAVTGRGGNLDTILVDRFGCIRLKADILDKSALQLEIARYEPDTIINCAAFTSVDDAELSRNRRIAMQTNSAGVCNIKDSFSGQLIYISTDYIFSGTSGPYTEKDTPDPMGWYGFTKWCGEKMVMEYADKTDVIVRTTVLYGGHKSDFANTVLKKLKLGYTAEVTDKLFGNPTHVHQLASSLIRLTRLRVPPKIINIAGKDIISRYDFAVRLAEVFGYDVDNVIRTDKVSGLAKRPYKAGLDTTLAQKLKIPIYTVEDGISQLFVEKAALYAKYPER